MSGHSNLHDDNDSLSDLEEDLSDEDNQEKNEQQIQASSGEKTVDDMFVKEFEEVLNHIADRVRRYASGLKPSTSNITKTKNAQH